jgi:hypothetical protein
MTVKQNVKIEAEKLSPAKDLSDRELDMVVGGINPQPLPPRSPRM